MITLYSNPSRKYIGLPPIEPTAVGLWPVKQSSTRYPSLEIAWHIGWRRRKVSNMTNRHDACIPGSVDSRTTLVKRSLSASLVVLKQSEC